ncbi:unnamed protein product [Ambrosiozyma monospora]|uniref:Unnamed protein product n=1 Tax=Ambrosiozyma monospora TaxID=43982 RepID=A0ACB5TBH5_AMBMO|nr:unnamed protein product [Ambrosiozyma monospora]
MRFTKLLGKPDHKHKSKVHSTSPSPSPSSFSSLSPSPSPSPSPNFSEIPVFNVRYPKKTKIFSSIHRRVEGHVEIKLPLDDDTTIESIDIGFKGDVRTRINEYVANNQTESSSSPPPVTGTLPRIHSPWHKHRKSSSSSSKVAGKIPGLSPNSALIETELNKDGVIFVLFDESFNVFNAETSHGDFNMEDIKLVPFAFMFPSFEKEGDLRLPSSGDSFCYAIVSGEANTTVRYELYVRVRAWSSEQQCYMNVDFLAPLKYQGGSVPRSELGFTVVESENESDPSPVDNDLFKINLFGLLHNPFASSTSQKKPELGHYGLKASFKLPMEISLDYKLVHVSRDCVEG